jgi:hypothetical protein
MPTIVPQPPKSQLARDASGKIVESVSVDNWRSQRQDVTAGAWTLLGDGAQRSAIYLKNNGTDDVILAPDDTNYSNDPAQATAGMTLAAGTSMEPTFGAKLEIHARTVLAGGTCQLEVVESF